MSECMNKLTGVAIVVVSVLDAAGQPVARPGEVVIAEVTVHDEALRLTLIKSDYDISDVHGDVLTIYATPDELAELRALGLECTETGRQPAPPEFSRPGSKALGVYHDYAGVTAALVDFAESYPDLCRLESLGVSVQGRDIWAMTVTDNPGIEEDEPEFKYVSTMHGDEPVGTELCLYLLDLLLSEYGATDRITDLVDSTEIWIVPVMNPDGLERGSRYNAAGYDINRSFPHYPDDFTGTFYDGESEAADGRPPEVRHIVEWTLDNSFVLSANIHTGALVVNYPYDAEPGRTSGMDAPTPDDTLFEDVSRRYSMYNPPMFSSTRFTDGITNGCAWYTISGSMQDWNYRYAGCNEVTLELSDVKRPPESTLPQLWEDNRESMLTYIESVHMGIRGIVDDGRTGEPLWARIAVAGNEQHVATDPDTGDYHRMLLPGEYDLEVSADGYVSQTVNDVVVEEAVAARVDVSLLQPDIDGDGIVGATDLQLIINAALGRPVSYNCDIDGGGMSATDIQRIINIILGYES